MIPHIPVNRSGDRAIQKYIGSAIDDVIAVAKQLDLFDILAEILMISYYGSVYRYINSIADNMDTLLELLTFTEEYVTTTTDAFIAEQTEIFNEYLTTKSTEISDYLDTYATELSEEVTTTIFNAEASMEL